MGRDRRQRAAAIHQEQSRICVVGRPQGSRSPVARAGHDPLVSVTADAARFLLRGLPVDRRVAGFGECPDSGPLRLLLDDSSTTALGRA